MNDISLIVTSIFGGCLMGIFMLGFFTTRVDGASATWAMVLAIFFNLYLGLGSLGMLPQGMVLNIHSYWVGASVNGFFIILAIAISFIRRKMTGDLTGLTVWTMRDKNTG